MSSSGIAAELTRINGFLVPTGEVVEAPCHQLLAGAGLALNHDGGVRRRDTRDFLAQLADGRALAEQGRRFNGRCAAPCDLALSHSSPHRQEQVSAIGRLRQVSSGPRLQTLARGELVAVPGENDDRDFEPPLKQVLQQRQAVHPRHLDIQECRVGWVCVELLEALKGVARLFHLVAGPAQDASQDLSNAGIIIDDQDCAFHGIYGSSVAGERASYQRVLPVRSQARGPSDGPDARHLR